MPVVLLAGAAVVAPSFVAPQLTTGAGRALLGAAGLLATGGLWLTLRLARWEPS
jgi:hypothetical protein